MRCAVSAGSSAANEECCLYSRRDAEFLQHSMNVRSCSRERYALLLSDLLIRKALPYPAQHFAFPRGESVVIGEPADPGGIRLARAQPCHHVSGLAIASRDNQVGGGDRRVAIA